MVIWFLDCSNGFVTKVNLSQERAKELETMDSYDFCQKYAKEFGVNFDDSSYMVSDIDNEVDVIDF
jgi:hypothetical protein